MDFDFSLNYKKPNEVGRATKQLTSDSYVVIDYILGWLRRARVQSLFVRIPNVQKFKRFLLTFQKLVLSSKLNNTLSLFF